jgi:hypothetical protein
MRYRIASADERAEGWRRKQRRSLLFRSAFAEESTYNGVGIVGHLAFDPNGE